MTTANCTRCNATATGGTLEEATLLLNHAVGLSRGIPCGDNYNCVVEITVDVVPDTIAPESSTQEETPIPETPKENDQNDSPIDTVSEKPSRKKSKFSY